MLVADFVWFGYLPSQDRLKTLRQVRRLQAAQIDRASHERLQLPSLRERLRLREAEIAQYEPRLPRQKGMGQFLEDMSGLMARHGLTEPVMIPLSETQVGSVRCLPITFRCQGSLAQVFSFYQELADLGRLVRVQKVHLSNADFRGWVSLEAQIVIFYRTTEGGEATRVASLL